MHELGILANVVENIEQIAEEEQLTEIDKIVLQIGELSPVIPKFVEACYPAAVDGTIMEHTKLEMEILPGNALCKDCNKVYNFLENKKICPFCGSDNWKIISGREFMIKEIVAY